MFSQEEERIEKITGKKPNEVWNFFKKELVKGSKGHYSAKCIFCNKEWKKAYINDLKLHLANNCLVCPEDIHSFYLNLVTNNNDNSSSSSTTNSKKCKTNEGQKGIEDFYENKELPDHKVQNINLVLTRAFACCGISFNIIDNPFFKEFLYELRPNYIIPTRQTLSGIMLNNEIIRVNLEINKEIERSENITLALDGWTSLSSLSIYSFLVLTSSRKQYLYSLRDYSLAHHTGEFLAAEIKTIIDQIGAIKIKAIVTDNDANVKLARELVTKEYPYIINLHCIAHFVNLITKSIIGKLCFIII